MTFDFQIESLQQQKSESDLTTFVRKAFSEARLERDDVTEYMLLIRQIKMEARQKGYSHKQIRKALQTNLEGYGRK